MNIIIGIDNVVPQAAWLGKKLQDWTNGISTKGVAAQRHLYAAYADLKKSLQQEGDFV